ncbi:hypothetical protein BTO04_07625 [Polaribacter sp. SA4-10]|uniref:DUF1566 domain-containing protein n=1 Tax=Polaribacter sp. SA4-10 TaxID=754397 RepID=UPI000B3CDB8A|nr:DUF1566 domain-containing protein [Polaribacter sp. SA4-10]ARV06577.1 hypothetical protein BTO04_07625 [Polaribacter sp. SA4-10]
MNKIRFTLLAALLITVSIFGQSPEQISYQAVVRDAANAIVANQVVAMKISVLQTTENGTAVYEELQTPTTNANGLLSIYIGAGTTLSGVFSNIVWSTGSYFVKIEIDATGNGLYTITGTTQLVSVPYALYAKATAAGTLTGTALNATVIGSSLTSVGTLTDLTVTGTSETGLVKITGGSPAVGKVLKSDADGLASWEVAPEGQSSGTTTGDMQYWNGTAWVVVAATPNEAATLQMISGVPTWVGGTPPPPPAVGDDFQGGKIFYIFQAGDTGYVAEETHGLIAAPSDQSAPGVTDWFNGSGDFTLRGTSTALGSGNANTDVIVAHHGTGPYAAYLCYNLTSDGYDDWYLPSKDELTKLYENKAVIDGMSGSVYWSSSERQADQAYVRVWTGYDGYDTKNRLRTVRAIRSF